MELGVRCDPLAPIPSAEDLCVDWRVLAQLLGRLKHPRYPGSLAFVNALTRLAQVLKLSLLLPEYTVGDMFLVSTKSNFAPLLCPQLG